MTGLFKNARLPREVHAVQKMTIAQCLTASGDGLHATFIHLKKVPGEGVGPHHGSRNTNKLALEVSLTENLVWLAGTL